MYYICFIVVFVLICVGFVLTYRIFLYRNEKAQEEQNLTRKNKENKKKKQTDVEKEPPKVEEPEIVEEISSEGLEEYSLDTSKKATTTTNVEPPQNVKGRLREKIQELMQNQNLPQDDSSSKIDVEAEYRELINRSGTKKEYTLDDFRRDFQRGVDINIIMKRMSPELRDFVLTKLLEKKNFDI